MSAQFIRFSEDDDGQAILGNYEWAGPWPPPEQLLRLVGKTAGFVSIAEQIPDDLRADVELYLDVTVFRRVSFSAISDADAAEMTHVARGALYSPVGAS